MPDSKYGALFTMNDLEVIVDAAVNDSESDLSAIVKELKENGLLTFPPDEPNFLLRGQDDKAGKTITYYGELCAAAGCSPEHLHSIRDAAHTFKEFAQDHPNRVKLPD